ncbi:MAG: glutathione S-transferase [Rhodospirillales bacterium]|nr:glutathione S-transferase [Rhodospirillales bacterium]
MRGRIIIGTRRYSSWSLRGWLPVRLAGLDVDEVVMPLAGGNTASIGMVSPGGTVPVLDHDGNLIWESLAIAEYCAELKPGLWPEDRAARALARSVSSEMHAGFRALRQAMPMSLFRNAAGAGRTPEVLADIARIEAIWHDCRSRFGGGGSYLFGATFTVADVMYAPVVCRFLTYRPELSAASRAYCDAVRAHPLIEEWYRAAAAEPESWRLAATEAPL